jgi:hypothetical protein
MCSWFLFQWVYTQTPDFCVLVFYPGTLLKVLIRSKCVLLESLSLLYVGSCHLQTGKIWLLPFLFVWFLLLFLAVLLWIRLYWIRGVRVHMLISFLILEKIQLSPFSIMLTVGLSNIAFIKLKYDPFNSHCFRMYHEEMLSFFKGTFCLCWNDHVFFVLYFIFVLYYFYWFLMLLLHVFVVWNQHDDGIWSF